MSKLKSITHTAKVRPPRMVILGVEKIGKSSFLAGAEGAIFIPIDLEEGIDDLAVAKFPTCKSLEDLMECLTALAEEDHKYKLVVVDSASALEPLIWKAVCEEDSVDSIEQVGGGYGKGYLAALEKWHTIMKAFDYLRDEKGMASAFIGHTKVKRFDDPERESYDAYQFDINEKVSNALYRWADFIGFANRSIYVNSEEVGFRKKKIKGQDGGERILCTQKKPAHPGGGRGAYGRLPDEISLEWSAFEEAVAEARAEMAAEAEPPKKKTAKK